jgi:hypothetical protein
MSLLNSGQAGVGAALSLAKVVTKLSESKTVRTLDFSGRNYCVWLIDEKPRGDTRYGTTRRVMTNCLQLDFNC